MDEWIEQLKVDPRPVLLSSDNQALSYFVRRDLMDQQVEPAGVLWTLPEVERITVRQHPDGSWKYSTNQESAEENYDLLETFRVLGQLIEKYGLERQHPAIQQAADYLFNCQTEEGDFRGIYGMQYSPNYSGAITELLIKGGYEGDSRIEKSIQWLLSIRQDDGGWAIPIRTNNIKWEDAPKNPSLLQPNRSKPFSHMVTGMVLRAFAVHTCYRLSPPAMEAGDLLLSRFFAPDKYVDRRFKSFWEKTSYPFWFTDIVSALDSVTLIGFTPENEQINAALNWLRDCQIENGLFSIQLLRARDKDSICWTCLAICRIFKRLYS